jgi:hypothetical protein
VKDGTQINVSFWQIRFQSQGAPITLFGFLQFAVRLEDSPQVGMKGAIFFVDGNRLPNKCNGSLMICAVIGDHAEQMQAVRMTGIDGQNLAIDSLRHGQAAGLVVANRLGQHVLNDPRRPLLHFSILVVREGMAMAIQRLQGIVQFGVQADRTVTRGTYEFRLKQARSNLKRSLPL